MPKYLFFGMPKTGSRFVISVLQGQLGSEVEILWHESLYTDGEIQVRGLGKEDMWRFCFVRNPYSRFISAYRWLMVPRRLNAIDAQEKKAMLSYGSLREFCLNLEEFTSDPEHAAIHFYPQNSWITDPAGDLTMDFVGKFESMNESWRVVTDRLSIPYEPVFGSHTKSFREKVVSARNNLYGRVRPAKFTPEIFELVRDFYDRDFELFGYSRDFGKYLKDS